MGPPTPVREDGEPSLQGVSPCKVTQGAGWLGAARTVRARSRNACCRLDFPP